VGANAAVKVEAIYSEGKVAIVLRAENADDGIILQLVGDKTPTTSRVSNGADAPKLLTVEFGGK
jgi:hypothetical protein